MGRQPAPYIGITGLMSPEEVGALLTTEGLKESSRLLMCGVLSSWKAMLPNGAPSAPTRYPRIEEIRNIFQDNPKALNLIHYNSKQPDLEMQLESLKALAGPYLHGFQLNIPWPPLRELVAWRANNPKMRLVIQISAKAYEEAGRSPKKLCQRLAEYREIATDFLFDPSGGRGMEFDAEEAKNVFHFLDWNFGHNSNIGVAGGIGPESIEKIEPLIKEFPRLSIDAEGKLRNSEDALDLGRASAYLSSALELTAKYFNPSI